MKKIIFCDTNKLFGTFRYFYNNGTLKESYLKDLVVEYKVFISTFVLFELYKISKNKISVDINENDIKSFVKYIGFNVVRSIDFDKNLQKYVLDPDDTQILQDAIFSKANIILTSNLTDFDIKGILENFQISVQNEI